MMTINESPMEVTGWDRLQLQEELISFIINHWNPAAHEHPERKNMIILGFIHAAGKVSEANEFFRKLGEYHQLDPIDTSRRFESATKCTFDDIGFCDLDKYLYQIISDESIYQITEELNRKISMFDEKWGPNGTKLRFISFLLDIAPYDANPIIMKINIEMRNKNESQL